jgi:hypothetical protein
MYVTAPMTIAPVSDKTEAGIEAFVAFADGDDHSTMIANCVAA